MSIHPIEPLWKALVAQLDTLGYNDSSCVGFPYIELEDFSIQLLKDIKDRESYEGTFAVDIGTKSISPKESLEILNKVLPVIDDEQIEIEGYTVQEITQLELTPIPQLEDGIYRQHQRYFIELTKNIEKK